MDKKIKNIAFAMMAVASAAAFSACDDYLDITPPSWVSPEQYFKTAEQLGNYTIHYYTSGDNWDAESNGGCFPFEDKGYAANTSLYHDDEGTDNECGGGAKGYFNGKSSTQVGATGGLWYFNRINELNYFLRTVYPRWEAGEIKGDEELIKHYIGEAHMLRASEYFFRMRRLGDLPIVTNCIPLDRDKLIESSRRKPRNLVARFILSDLDSAINLLSDGAKTGGTNRITRDAALLLKARVALFEATFEKHFAGTPFVPDAAAGWPGAKKDYNKDFVYDNQTEVNFFIDQAMAAAKEVADAHPLASNSKRIHGDAPFSTAPSNDYYNMFAGNDASSYSEVLLWHAYSKTENVAHSFNLRTRNRCGFTQEFSNSFLMESGKPVYAAGDEYKGDDYIEDTKVNRDWRWRLFMKAPGEYLFAGDDRIRHGAEGKKIDGVTTYVPAVYSTSHSYASRTGYAPGKMVTTNAAFSSEHTDETNTIVYRSAEAFLIYLEAAWYKFGDALDGTAWDYWRELRKRAGVGDPDVTIQATDLDKEWEYTKDLGLYSAGQRITSKVLYNIRRERRCEFIQEGQRLMDLIRWRALDQLVKNEPSYVGAYHLHGCKIYGPMSERLKSKNLLKYDQSDPTKNVVSSPNDTETDKLYRGNAEYLSLFRINPDNEWYDDGMTWKMAHYLMPIAQNHFLESSPTGSDPENSPIYQNPYWSIVPQTSAER